MAGSNLEIQADLSIPEDEIREVASRAGGPGGQHVNKANTRVTLRWDIRGSGALREDQRERLLMVLRSRLTREGELIVHADRRRSRARNRDDARLRIVQLVGAALAESPVRHPTRPSKASKIRVQTAKRQRAEVKRGRGRVHRDSGDSD